MITVIITSSMSIMFLFYHQFLLINSVLNFMCTTFFSYFILYYTNLTSLHFYSIFQFLNTQYFLQYCCPFAKLRTTIFYLTRHILSFRYNSVCERIRYYILIQFICQLYFIKLKAWKWVFFYLLKMRSRLVDWISYIRLIAGHVFWFWLVYFHLIEFVLFDFTFL